MITRNHRIEIQKKNPKNGSGNDAIWIYIDATSIPDENLLSDLSFVDDDDDDDDKR